MWSGLSSIVLLPAAVWWVLTGGGMWVAASRGSRRAVWVISLLGAAVLAALALDVIMTCSADPVFVPPEGDEGDGLMIFPCDAPAGTYVRIFLRVTLPITLVGQGLLTWWMLDRVQ